MKITNCKLNKRVQNKLLEFFVLQVTARSAADILGIQPNSAILFYRKIRMVISHYLALAADEVFEGPVELDESYFGRHRKGRRGRGAAGKVVVFGILKRNGRVYTVVVDVEADESYFGGHRKGKRGRGAAGKTAVFGLLKRNDKVYTVAVPNTQTATLLPIIREQVTPDSIVYTDCYKGYDVLDVSGFIHHRINHSKEFADRQNHINGIGNFWNQVKRVLRKYNGIDRKSFPLFLKECEFRFNFGTPSRQLKILRDWCGIYG